MKLYRESFSLGCSIIYTIRVAFKISVNLRILLLHLGFDILGDLDNSDVPHVNINFQSFLS